MELQTSGMFYNGENNSKSIKVIIEENLRDKNIFLDFETADGRKYQSEKLTLDENGECDYFVPGPILTGEGQGLVQIIATKNDFTEKSKLYKFNILKSINATKGLETIYITENGVYDVTNYSSANVNVSNDLDNCIDGSMTSLTSMVTSIREYCFYRLYGLTNINLPNVTRINDNAFGYCTKLTNIDLPSLRTLGSYCFYNCSALTDVNIPNVTSIGSDVFWNCGNLTNINMPNVTSIGSNAFIACKSLTSINIPNVTSIGSSAFRGCEKITSIDLPNITTIKESSFAQCRSLMSINIPNVTNIEREAFQYCHCTEIDFPNVTSLGYGVFSGSTYIKNVNLPNIVDVQSSLFYNCSYLISVNVPKVKNIYASSFSNCYSLKEILIEQTDKVCTLASTNVFSNCYRILGTKNISYNPNGLKDGYIYVPASLLSQYKVATNWITYASQIVGHQDYVAGDELVNYSNGTYTTCTWYSDKEMTIKVTSVNSSGRYYCKLEA